MAQFANTSSDEQETLINIDYSLSEVYVYKEKKVITQVLSRPTLIGGKQ